MTEFVLVCPHGGTALIAAGAHPGPNGGRRYRKKDDLRGRIFFLTSAAWLE